MVARAVHTGEMSPPTPALLGRYACVHVFLKGAVFLTKGAHASCNMHRVGFVPVLFPVTTVMSLSLACARL
jgi:hypothetical protein